METLTILTESPTPTVTQTHTQPWQIGQVTAGKFKAHNMGLTAAEQKGRIYLFQFYPAHKVYAKLFIY